MPLLDRPENLKRRGSRASALINDSWQSEDNPLPITSESVAGRLLATCANPECSSRWMHLLRSRSGPIFEGGWTCSPACTLARVEAALHRELDGRLGDSAAASPSAHSHRVPLGLVLLEQGWITQQQLRKALTAQREAGQGRLGAWLIRQGAVSEGQITRALSLQWSCPVLHADTLDADAMAAVLPRLFVEAYGALPLRIAAGRILYVGFEERLDPVVGLALERMTGLQVETGLVPEAQFAAAQRRLIESSFPSIELVESASEAPLARVLARALERRKPATSRLVRLHDCLWLRLWPKAPTSSSFSEIKVEDVVCSLIAG